MSNANLGSAIVIRGNALHLPLPNSSVDLICTSPPYFGLRSYQDAGAHYTGQLGSEATPAEFLEALLAATREMVRVLKPSGSLFVNLGDKYGRGSRTTVSGSNSKQGYADPGRVKPTGHDKSLMGIPWRYAIACIDQLGLILRAEIIWAKPNGLPESVTDRVRRSHETWFHFTRQPRYFAAVDEIREEHSQTVGAIAWRQLRERGHNAGPAERNGGGGPDNPLGKLPGSVWTIPTQPLEVPPELGIDHFACVDAETEILTSVGWRKWYELKSGDIAAGYDLITNRAKWTEVKAVHSYHYNGDMVSVESRDLSMRLTPNHRAVVQRMNSYTKKRGPISIVQASQLDRYHFIPRSTPWEHTTDDSVGTGWASILGWVAAEGWYQGRCVYLSQSATANPDKVKQIDALLPDVTWRRERQREWRGNPTLEVEWRLSDEDAKAVQAAMPLKLLPASLITATMSERWAVLTAFIAGDGHTRVNDGRIAIFQTKRHNLDVLQAIAVTLGYKTSLQFGGERHVLYLTHGGRSTTLRTTNGAGSKVEREHYEGAVWCATTGTGTFIARRRGIPFITGNSYPMEWPRRIIQGWTPSGGRVVDVFGGTGTTALVAKALGRHGITIDLSADYCRLAEWRCNNPQQLAQALQVEKPDVIPVGQLSLFEEIL